MNKENTFRALADKPLVVESWLCRFGWHRWSKWSDLPPRSSNTYSAVLRSVCVNCNCAREKRYRYI